MTGVASALRFDVPWTRRPIMAPGEGERGEAKRPKERPAPPLDSKTEWMLDESVEESFPASDPPAHSFPGEPPGAASRREEE